jgi:hypothetical protein
MLKKAVQQGRSERSGEEVRTALRVTVRPAMNLSEQTSPFSVRGVPLNGEPLSDARTPLADFFSIPLQDVHGLRGALIWSGLWPGEAEMEILLA